MSLSSHARFADALAAIPPARRDLFHQQLQRQVVAKLEQMDPDLCIDIALALAENAGENFTALALKPLANGMK